MKDEIKEILERLKDSVINPIINVPVMGGVSEPIDNSQCLEPNECKLLLDYITNLQEENKILRGNTDLVNLELIEYKNELEDKIDKAVEIYKNRSTCKYKKERFMEDKSTSDLMYETLTCGDE